MIKENVEILRQKILVAAEKVRVSPKDITIIAVTKGVGPAQVCEAIDEGLAHFGESKVQEALLKYETVSQYAQKAGQTLTWHMIGHLQTNKVKEAVRIFDLIQSVDSLRLAREIDRAARAQNEIQDILLEVNVSGEQTKFGFSVEQVYPILKEISQFSNICVKGLMTIAPIASNPEEARPFFRRLKELKNEINGLPTSNFGLQILSMGMTDDFEVAIEEGANRIRIGRGIFGERQG